ncbi:hypothetical protein KUA11_17330, partial [Acetobacter estunensis]|nr:hypothetical protein [Acetobacter estunensis]
VDEESPNLDGLLWFAREVMPLVRAELGPDTRLTVVGSCSRGVGDGRSECPRTVTFPCPACRIISASRSFTATTCWQKYAHS